MSIGETGVQVIKLRGWPKQEALDFVNRTVGGDKYSADDKEKILHLSRCQPLYLTLATQNMQRLSIIEEIEKENIVADLPLYRAQSQGNTHVNETLPPNVDFDELSESGQEFVRDFEGQLFLHLAGTSPLAKVMRRMAHLRRRCNAAMYQQILNFEPAIQGASTWEEIYLQPWVRHRTDGYITLHDIVGELLRKHIWPLRDPSGEKRRGLSKRVVTIYDEQVNAYEQKIADLNAKYDQLLKEVNEQIQAEDGDGLNITEEEFPELAEIQQQILDSNRRLWVIVAEKLYYELDADINSGYQSFIEKFDSAGKQGQLMVRELILSEIENFLDEFKPGSEEYYEIALREIDAAIDDNLLQKADEKAQYLLKHYQEPNHQYELIKRQGNIYLRMPGRESEGVEAFQKIRKLTRKYPELTEKKGDTLLEIGWAYRQLGRWPEAVNAYKDARDATPLHNQITRAFINNGLAYVEALIGEYDDAESCIDSALTHFRNQKNQEYVGMGLSVQGEVFRYQEKFSEALEFYDEAIGIFTAIESSGWLGVVQQEKAICLIQGDSPLNNLEDAQYYSESACYLCREHNPRYSPSALNRAARVYSLAKEYNRALNALRDGVEAAQAAQDPWFLIANCVEYAELAFRLWYDTDNANYREIILEYQDQVDEKEQTGEYAFADLFGRWHLVKGHFAWHEGILTYRLGNLDEASIRWQEALDEYAVGFPMIARGHYGSHGVRALPREVDMFHRHVLELPITEGKRWCETLNKTWGARENPAQLSARIEKIYGDLLQKELENDK